MNLEDQVCSLELAKKLKELGVKQESIFWWIEFVNGWELRFATFKVPTLNDVISAFTVAELGEGLPDECVSYYADTEANARALMLIYLIENRLVKI